jgi:hypothetical protein
MRRTIVPPEVLAVLGRSQLNGSRLMLPEQLPRPLYIVVNDVLTRLGGRWTRSNGAHVFPGLASDAIASVLETGRVDPRNPTAFYATPAWLAADMAERVATAIAGYTAPRVLEPSAGEGALADAVRVRLPEATVDLYEIDAGRRATLEAKGYTITGTDFLAAADGACYDAVIMNPPFAVPGDALAYITHLMRAWATLKPGGTLVAIAPAGFMFRETRAIASLRQQLGNLTMQALPPDAFDEAGTSVHTVLVEATLHVARAA